MGPGGGYDDGEEQRAGYKVSTTPPCKHSFNRHVLSTSRDSFYPWLLRIRVKQFYAHGVYLWGKGTTETFNRSSDSGKCSAENKTGKDDWWDHLGG